MKKTHIIILSLILGLAVLIKAIDVEYFIYGYYRVLNGTKFPELDAKLADGFYFFKKSEDDKKHHVYSRHNPSIPLFILPEEKITFSDLLSKDLVSIYLELEGCTVYRDNAHPKNIYFDFDGVLGAVIYVDEVSKSDIQMLCGMLLKSGSV